MRPLDGSSGEMPLQAVGEILEIVEPLAQIGVGRLDHAGAGLVSHLLHRGFGGEAASIASVMRCEPARSAANMR